ncbi:MAG: alanine racemase [Candidatus Sumerlaeaceae bacterium]|nr:alanine racemase [Candidatus Sumerlaeaceae bacterium]
MSIGDPGLLAPDSYLTWAEIDVGAVRHNFRQMRGLASPAVRVFAVVKADAYGHGAVPVARALADEGADMLCVARVEEALELRRNGLRAPLLVFAPPFLLQAELLIAANARGVVCASDHIEAAAAAARRHGHRLAVYLKVDVGMGRLGCKPADALALARSIRATSNLQLEGVMSHLPCADGPPESLTRQHIAIFDSVRRLFEASGFHGLVWHLANSAATMDYPEAHFDAVRTGIALYGQYPSPDIRRRVDLRPAMSLKTRIVYLKDVPKGTGLSYGHTFIAPRPMRVATVPIGYADGYPRHASNRTVMLVRGCEAPVVGRVCMDQVLLDVTDCPGVQQGDEVLVFGRSGDHFLPADAVAAMYGSIGYELTTRLGRRVPRFYL